MSERNWMEQHEDDKREYLVIILEENRALTTKLAKVTAAGDEMEDSIKEALNNSRLWYDLEPYVRRPLQSWAEAKK